MSDNVFISIDYDDAYKAVVISGPGALETRFESGDPPVDYARAYVHGLNLARSKGVAFMSSSSLDGFVFDVPGWCYTRDDMLVRDERDYHADGTLKTKAELDAEDTTKIDEAGSADRRGAELAEALAPAHAALDRMKRAHGRGTGCRLTAAMLQSLSVTTVGQLWSEEHTDG